MAPPVLPVHISRTPVVSVPADFTSRSVVVQPTAHGEVVVKNRRSWRVVGSLLAPQAWLLPQLLRHLFHPGPAGWLAWVSGSALVMLAVLVLLTARTGGVFQLWFGPRSWGRKGLLRSHVLAPAAAMSAHYRPLGRQFEVSVRDARGRHLRLALVHEEPAAAALVGMLHDYARRAPTDSARG